MRGDTHGWCGMRRRDVYRRRVVDRRGTYALVGLLLDTTSLLLLLGHSVLGNFARSETQSAVVTFAQQGEEQNSKDGLGEEVEQSIPEELSKRASG